MKWQLTLNCPRFKRGPRHSINERGFSILTNRLRTGISHGKKTLSTVPTHTGQDDADCFGPHRFGQ